MSYIIINSESKSIYHGDKKFYFAFFNNCKYYKRKENALKMAQRLSYKYYGVKDKFLVIDVKEFCTAQSMAR